ncbi:MAG: pilin [bacterium]|nr:pilin [bacterium]
MKPSKNNLLILATLLLFLIVIPTVTNAFSLIEPDKCSGNLCIPKGAKYCTICDGLNVVKGGMDYLIYIGISVAVLFITYGAILIMVGGAMPAKIQEGKKAIVASVVGVILMLMAWIIVNQVFFLFVNKSITGKPWNKIECPQEERLDCILGPGTPIATRGTSTTGATTTTRGANNIAESNIVRDKLISDSGGKISMNNNNCPPTCLDGLSQSAKDGALGFVQKSKCDVVITGGTETTGGHGAGHLAGDKLDFRSSSSCVSNYITNGFEKMPNRSDGAIQYKDPGTGYVYALESDHWDVRFTK